MSERKSLWVTSQNHCLGVVDADKIYINFKTFLEKEDHMGSGESVYVNWKWIPSIEKVKEQKIEIEINLEDEEEMEAVIKGSEEPHKNKQCYLYYEKYDYLVLERKAIWNASDCRYKITVTDKDEEMVYNFLKKCKEQFIKNFGI